MRANYGYADATGEYYITIDTDRCDGCGECITACPEDMFELIEDDFGKLVAAVREEVRLKVGIQCPGFHAACYKNEVNCHAACKNEAISHSW
ncbi:MAG: ferredoxin [Chloroflexi bacterium]|nr:MAG: ferredoxin [Chloroflexota bacterium]